MNPWSPSVCPICRARYVHLPGVCGLLHHFLAVEFSDQYALRRRETEEEEKEGEAASPEPPPPDSLPLGLGRWEERHFMCASPACGALLLRPTVLTCGHVVCAPCCAPQGAGFGCPACGERQPQRPSVCNQLHRLLQRLFPEAQARREAETPASAATSRQASMALLGAGGGEAALGDSMAGDEEAPSTPRTQQQSPGSPGSPRSPAGADAASPSGPAPTLSPSLAAAVERGREQADGSGAGAERLQGNLLHQLSTEDYAHHGVGCDNCGLYPIVGRFAQHHRPDHRMEQVRPRLTAMHLLQAANPDLPAEQLLWLLELTMGVGEGEEEEEENSAGGGAGPPGGGEDASEWQPGAAAGEPAQEEQQQASERRQQAAEQPALGARREPPGQRQPAEQPPQPPAGGGGDARDGAAEGAGVEDRPIPPPRGRGPRPVPDPTAVWPSPSAM
eukprot:scaffold1.g5473.t1